ESSTYSRSQTASPFTIPTETDMNVVMTEDGRIIEVQGTAEGEPFTHEELLTLLALARGGIESIVATQKAALAN
ncbi:hypothetical protein ACSLNL_13880, partial [Escherichia coli]